MNVVSLERRLARIEAAAGPMKGVVFVVWGRDQAEIEARCTAAQAARDVTAGDQLARILWPATTQPPASRWLPDSVTSGLTHSEFGSLALWASVIVDQLRPGQQDGEEDVWPAGSRPDRVRRLNDARLVAASLADRVGSDAVSIGARPDLARVRAIEALLELDLRARIRGCYAELGKAIAA